MMANDQLQTWNQSIRPPVNKIHFVLYVGGTPENLFSVIVSRCCNSLIHLPEKDLKLG